MTSQSGLSPLARGTLDSRLCGGVSSRFIPAGAGNTCTTTAATSPGPVYPRWRGEHSEIRYDGGEAPGLSPLARGTLEALTR
ncbi:hypothetical protein SEEV1955_12532 [Salmonella enterica subsp. enterica serovar Virchow str. ATCC 51955]|nr:hypothetical protein SEEV1955_12532 [Salmonella enterica subsp. enterica serovar Virchow str. ATCC 51955]